MMQLKIIVGVIAAIFIIAALGGNIAGFVTSAVCGNNFCELEENKGNCPADCKSLCGDFACEDAENFTCLQDCTAPIRAAEKTSTFSNINFLTPAAVLIALLVLSYPFISKQKKPKRRRH